MVELQSIQARLKRFEKMLYGINYECHFTFEKVCDGTDPLTAREILNEKHKLTWQKKIALELIPYDEFLSDISEKLLHRGDRSAGVSLHEKQEADFRIQLHEFKELLKNKFPASKSAIYSHPEISTSIFWGFCFLIVSRERKTVYVFDGLASD